MSSITHGAVMDKLVSVFIPVYNHESYVCDAIESVLRQTYSNIELIVVNDGSTDGSHALIKKMSEEYGFLYINQDNQGLSKTLKAGLKLCNGYYYALLASDDSWEIDKIEQQVRYMSLNTSCVACCAHVNVIDEVNKRYVNTKVKPGGSAEIFDFDRIMMEGYKIPPATIFIRKNNLSEQNFRDDLKVEDLFLWLTLTRNGGTIDVLPQVLANYRIHSQNTTADLWLIAKYHHIIIDTFEGTSVYAKAKNEWRKFSFRQLSRKHKIEALRLITLDKRFIFSFHFAVGIVKIIFVWK